jgi:hypothetical protein
LIKIAANKNKGDNNKRPNAATAMSNARFIEEQA